MACPVTAIHGAGALLPARCSASMGRTSSPVDCRLTPLSIAGPGLTYTRCLRVAGAACLQLTGDMTGRPRLPEDRSDVQQQEFPFPAADHAKYVSYSLRLTGHEGADEALPSMSLMGSHCSRWLSDSSSEQGRL